MHITPPGRPFLSGMASSWILAFLFLALAGCSKQGEMSEPASPPESDTADVSDSGGAQPGEDAQPSEDAIIVTSQQQRTVRVLRFPDAGASNAPENAPAAQRRAPSSEVAGEESQEEGDSRGSANAVRASALFTGPGRYPPREFAAYGILAFPSGATPGSIDRYMAICQGYIAAVPAASSLTRTAGVPLDRQMVTVWPLQDPRMADSLNASRVDGDQCSSIVSSIDIVTSLQAIREASASVGEARLSGPGPFLIAWSPGSSKGSADVPVLLDDLSNVINVSQASAIFDAWKRKIERNPELWSNGWSLARLRVTLRLLADKYGTAILDAIGG